MGSLLPRVLAVVTTYRRPLELRRLLLSLQPAAAQGLAGIVVVDNAADSELFKTLTEGACGDDVSENDRVSAIPVRYVSQAFNAGHGAGHAAGLSLALDDLAATHFWLLDDDAEALPDTLGLLLADMSVACAGAAVPLLETEKGELAWYPGPLDERRWRAIRRAGMTAEKFRSECGVDPANWRWSPWCMLLLTRGAVEEIGLPRQDFGFMGDDIEYSLRLSSRHRTVLVPQALGRHLPPAEKVGAHGFYTDCLNLQNLSYVSWRLSHGARARRHWPGHFKRFFKKWGYGPRSLRAALCAVWRGVVCGQPGGVSGYDQFRRRWLEAKRA